MQLMLIRHYLNESLRPLLKSLGLGTAAQELVCDDVRCRLDSILGNWADVEFRETALLLGMEEATFYEPKSVPLEVRAMVVVAVRNSMIEDLSAQYPFVPSLRRFAESLPDSFVPTITREAILFFNQGRRSDQGWGISPPKRDRVFRELAKAFPQSWRRLGALAIRAGQEFSISATEISDTQGKNHPPIETRLREEHKVCLSGFMPQFTMEDSELFDRICSAPDQAFFSHSFKWFTRNPAKLLSGMEMLLQAGCNFVTSNYYISKDYCARRSPLIRPAHTVPELEARQFDLNGAVGKHRDTLVSLAGDAKAPINLGGQPPLS